jgi:exopolyphosphatase/guanosine-5'-triphosphate,3'-diphosphate pyrophosphatase
MKKSYKIGVSRILELYPLSNPPQEKELANHLHYFQEELKELLPLITKYKVNGLIGTAGSFDTWRKVLEGANDGIPFYALDKKDLINCIANINSLTTSERLKINGLEDRKIETIVPAGILVAYLLDCFGFESIHQCEYSLAEGVLWEMIND